MELIGFRKTTFTFDGIERDVYRAGTGPAVVIMHELPGLTPEVIRFARHLAAEGLHSVLPVLFGNVGQPVSLAYLLHQFARLCIRREFYVLASNRSSPITDWLRALCRTMHEECGGPGVGAVGMCATGGLVLSLMLDESVIAPVTCQPSLPLPLLAALRSALGISDEELVAVKRRVTGGCDVLGLRFSCDRLCPAARFETLKRELGTGFQVIEVDSRPGNRHGVSSYAHSMLTFDLIDQPGHPTQAALERVLLFLSERLLVPRDCQK